MKLTRDIITEVLDEYAPPNISARELPDEYQSALRTLEDPLLRRSLGWMGVLQQEVFIRGPWWRAAALSADLDARRLLLLDDVEAVAGRRSTEAELARLLERSALGGPRLVVAAGRHPREIEGLQPSLCSRLAAGPVLRLPAPGREQLGRARSACKVVSACADRPSPPPGSGLE